MTSKENWQQQVILWLFQKAIFTGPYMTFDFYSYHG